MSETNQTTDISVTPILEPISKPIPVEPDFPIGGPTPEATIIVGGGKKASEARLSADSILPVQNRIEGSESPDILFSTPGDDLVLAKGGDDTIFGSLGNDTYSGGDGFDTLDYSLLGQKITLLPRGFIGNGSSQGSQIQGIERIVGAAGRNNTIDGSGGGKTDVFFTINLAEEQLIVENTPTFGSVEFEVENFVNVEGTENADSITGDEKKNIISGNGGDDNLIGGLESDTLNGGLGNDTLIGSDPLVENTPGSERDFLTGGAGTDKFVLGNELGSFYDDFSSNDFARITDFSFGEQIQLASGETYNIEQNSSGFNIFIVEDSVRDVIAKVTVAPIISQGMSSARANNIEGLTAKTESNVSALLGDIPEVFTINSGDEIGIFVA